MTIFNSYVSLPKGNQWWRWVCLTQNYQQSLEVTVVAVVHNIYEVSWEFQDPIYWRYPPYGLFVRPKFQGNIPTNFGRNNMVLWYGTNVPPLLNRILKISHWWRFFYPNQRMLNPQITGSSQSGLCPATSIKGQGSITLRATKDLVHLSPSRPWEIRIATVSNNKPPIWGEGFLTPFWYNWRWCIELGEVRTFIQLNLLCWAGATLCPALCWKTQQCTVGPWHDGGALLLTTPESVTPLGMCITTTHLPDKNSMFATHSLSYFMLLPCFPYHQDWPWCQSSSFKLAMGYPEMG